MTMETVTPEDVGFSSARLRRIDDTMRRFVDDGKIAGAVTLVARQGRVAHWRTFGRMDIEADRPMERDAIFRIYSMTKPVTATAVMMLFEEGHLLLNDPIANFLPEFAQTKVFAGETADGVDVKDLDRPITIRHLLTHTSGLTYGSTTGSPVARQYSQEQIERSDESLDQKATRIAHLPLLFQPGTSWNYGLSIDVLGRLVEVISAQSFDAFLRERIFNPLEMVDTGFVVPPQNAGRLATVYTSREDGRVERDNTPERDFSKPKTYHSPGGGLVSTAADYARFGQMLLNEGVLGTTRLLGRKTVELMIADHLSHLPNPISLQFPGEDGFGFGLGGSTVVDAAQTGLPTSAGSYSWLGAASTGFWIDPREQLFGLLLLQLMPLDGRLIGIFQALAYQALVD